MHNCNTYTYALDLIGDLSFEWYIITVYMTILLCHASHNRCVYSLCAVLPIMWVHYVSTSALEHIKKVLCRFAKCKQFSTKTWTTTVRVGYSENVFGIRLVCIKHYGLNTASLHDLRHFHPIFIQTLSRSYNVQNANLFYKISWIPESSNPSLLHLLDCGGRRM